MTATNGTADVDPVDSITISPLFQQFARDAASWLREYAIRHTPAATDARRALIRAATVLDDEIAPRPETTVTGKIIAATDRKRILEAEVRILKDQLEPLHEQMLDEFANRGETSARHAATGKLVYINRRTWARAAGGDKNRAYQALLDAGLDDYAERGFNTQKLSAYFRELIKQHEDEGQPVTDPAALLPKELVGAIELTTDRTIAVRS